MRNSIDDPKLQHAACPKLITWDGGGHAGRPHLPQGSEGIQGGVLRCDNDAYIVENLDVNVFTQWPARQRAAIDLPRQLDGLPIMSRLDAPYLELLAMYEFYRNQRFRIGYGCTGGSRE
jgi:hypothetical protein